MPCCSRVRGRSEGGGTDGDAGSALSGADESAPNESSPDEELVDDEVAGVEDPRSPVPEDDAIPPGLGAIPQDGDMAPDGARGEAGTGSVSSTGSKADPILCDVGGASWDHAPVSTQGAGAEISIWPPFWSRFEVSGIFPEDNISSTESLVGLAHEDS